MTKKLWDFLSNKFKPFGDFINEKDKFVCTVVDVFEDDENPAKPRLTLEKEEEAYLFDLNVTNSNFCKNAGIKSPKNLLGKGIFFKKVFVNSPKTKKEVESLRICRIE